MTTVLTRILRHKQWEVTKTEKRVPLSTLTERSRPFPILDFQASLGTPGIQIIAEIKRKSPSSGEIRPEADPVIVAREYRDNGAAAISVLTDRKYFGGKMEYIHRVKSAVFIPVLRKDFIISRYQVIESYLAGADAILLIAGIVPRKTLASLYELAVELGLSVLIELFSPGHLKEIKGLNPGLVGVNARNLETMRVDLNRLEEIFPLLPPDSLKVAESGVRSPDDLHYIADLGYDAALVGTALMRSPSPGGALKNLLKGFQT